MRITSSVVGLLCAAVLVAAASPIDATPTEDINGIAAVAAHSRSKRTIGFFLQQFVNAFATPPAAATPKAAAVMPAAMVPVPTTTVAPPPPPPPPPPSATLPATRRPPVRYNFFGVAFPIPSLFTVAGTATPAAAAPPPPAAPPVAPAVPPAPPAPPAPAQPAAAPAPNQFFFNMMPPKQLPIPADPTAPAAPQSTLPPPPPPPAADTTPAAPAPEEPSPALDSDESPELPSGGDSNDNSATDEDSDTGNADFDAAQQPAQPAAADPNVSSPSAADDDSAFFSGPDSFRKFWDSSRFTDDGGQRQSFGNGIGGFGGSGFGSDDGGASNRFQFNLENYNNGEGFYNAPQQLRRAAPTQKYFVQRSQQLQQQFPAAAAHQAVQRAGRGAGGAHSSVKMHDANYQYVTYHGGAEETANNGAQRHGRQAVQTQFFGRHSSVGY